MPWDAIGAVGEAAGALAVVVTLIFLAREMRTNTRAIAGSSTREIWLTFSNWNREIARDPELKRIAVKSMQSRMADYTGDEWQEFMTYSLAFFSLLQADFVNTDLDIGYRASSPLVETAGAFVKKYPAWDYALSEWSDSLEPRLVATIRASGAEHPELTAPRTT